MWTNSEENFGSMKAKAKMNECTFVLETNRSLPELRANAVLYMSFNDNLAKPYWLISL